MLFTPWNITYHYIAHYFKNPRHNGISMLLSHSPPPAWAYLTHKTLEACCIKINKKTQNKSTNKYKFQLLCIPHKMSYKTVIHTNLFLICFDKKLLKNHVKSVYKAYTWWLQGHCLWDTSVHCPVSIGWNGGWCNWQLSPVMLEYWRI